MLHVQKQRIVTSSWIKMFLGRQHPGCGPRQLYCFSPGWVSGQSEVMQNVESKTSSDGDESSVHWWFTLFFFNSFPVVAFITRSFFPFTFLYLFFPSLSYHFPAPFSPCFCHHSDPIVLAVMHPCDPTLETLCRTQHVLQKAKMDFKAGWKLHLFCTAGAGSILQSTLPHSSYAFLSGVSQI